MGELADDAIDRMINEMLDAEGWEEYRRYLEMSKKDLQDFAKDKLDEVKHDKQTKNLNKGVIDW
jgi:hypothetical protein